MNIIAGIITAMRSDSNKLSEKAATGVMWMILRQVIFQSLLVFKLILVARLLGPNIFGVFGITLLVVNLLERFSYLGIDEALIHYRENEKYLNSAWTIKFVRGLILFVLIIGFQNIILTTFGIKEYRLVLIIVATTLLFEVLVNIGTIDFRKSLNYQKEFWFRVSPDFANIIFTIVLALIIHNIWALVIGLLAERVVRVILSYTLHPFRPRISFELDKIYRLLGFGKWVLILSILGFLYLQGAELLIGLTLTASLLAVYQLSFKLATLTTLSISELLGGVTLPTYAKLQDDTRGAITTFSITLKAQILLFLFYFSVLIPISSEFILIILGPWWTDMITIFRILLFAGLFILTIQNIEPIFVANGLQKRLVKWQILHGTILFSIGLIVVKHYGLVGMSFVVLGGLTQLAIGYLIELRNYIKLPWRLYAREITLITIPSISVILISYVAHNVVVIDSILKLILHLIVNSALWAGLIYLTHRLFTIKLLDEVLSLINQVISSD